MSLEKKMLGIVLELMGQMIFLDGEVNLELNRKKLGGGGLNG